MRLYALCDQDMLNRYRVSIENFIDIAKKEKAEIVQYRNKSASLQEVKQSLIKIRKIFDGFLIVNERYELTDFCDGVHIGQEDLKKIDKNPIKAMKILRKLVGSDKIIGLSTHNKEEIEEANLMDLNYIGLGAYRSTSTKDDISVVLGDKLDEIASHSKHYVGAIGGVKKSDKFKNVTYHVIGSELLK